MKSKSESFCEEFFLRAQKYTDSYGILKRIQVGSKTINLSFNPESYFGKLISGAFIESHLPANISDFTIYVWDSSFPDILPNFTWAEEHIYSNLVIDYQFTQPYRVLFDRGQGMISVFNTETRVGGIWMRDHSQLDPRCFVSPFRTLMSWIAETFNSEIIHASGIEVEGRGVLISGPSGSGKSSLAIFAALEGYGIISDDAVLYENGYLYPIYSRAKVEKNNGFLDTAKLETFTLENSPDGKNILPLQSFGNQFVSKIALTCFVFSSVDSISEIKQVPSEIAAGFLIEHSLRELFGGLPANKIRLALLLKKYVSFKQRLSGNIKLDLQVLISEVKALAE